MTSKLPSGLPYIIGNELAERFSYYGMKSILVVFMTSMLVTHDGSLDLMAQEEAKAWFHIFSAGNYLLPLLGALVADIFWGKYKTIILLSLVYCVGHLALAIDDTRFGLAIGLSLIAVGSGGIKPCVSAHMGDQFKVGQESILSRAFQWFYLSINMGAFASTLAAPFLLEHYGPSVAFGIPGAAMFIATIVFWFGRSEYIVVKPVGWKAYQDFFRSRSVISKLSKLALLYCLLSVFWSLFDQTGSSWVLQAKQLDNEFTIFGLQVSILAAQMQALNPILIVILIPIFQRYIDPLILDPLGIKKAQRIALGLFLAALSFFVIGIIQYFLDLGAAPSIIWQAVAYLLLTAGEVLVSITALEMAYTSAPQSMKCFVSAFYLLSVSLGNIVTAGINAAMINPSVASLFSGAKYYVFFGVISLATALVVNQIRNYFTTPALDKC